jgi:hypothetical protein
MEALAPLKRTTTSSDLLQMIRLNMMHDLKREVYINLKFEMRGVTYDRVES